MSSNTESKITNADRINIAVDILSSPKGDAQLQKSVLDGMCQSFPEVATFVKTVLNLQEKLPEMYVV